MSFPHLRMYGADSCWMVSRGMYSDYSVLAIFTNEIAAQGFKAAYEKANDLEPDGDWDFVSIEEMPLGQNTADIFGPFWVLNDIVLEDGTLGRFEEIQYGPDKYGVPVQETGPVAEGYRFYFEPAGGYADISKRAVLIRTVRRTEREVRSAHNIALQQVQRQVIDPLFNWEDNLS